MLAGFGPASWRENPKKPGMMKAAASSGGMDQDIASSRASPPFASACPAEAATFAPLLTPRLVSLDQLASGTREMATVVRKKTSRTVFSPSRRTKTLRSPRSAMTMPMDRAMP